MSRTILPIHPRTGLRAVGIVAGRPVWPIFGAAPDDDQDDTGDDDAEDVDDNVDQNDAGDSDSDADADDDKPLGPKGEKALQAEKGRRRKEAERRRAAEAELEKLRNEAAKKNGDDPDADKIRQEAEQQATAKANARIVRSEIRAAAAGKLADPKDALTFLDTSQFEVDESGEVDSDEVADAIDELLKSKPYLAAATAKRFQGTGDGGAARKAGKPKQLTRDDVKRMSPEQIAKAQDEGRLADLLAGK